MPQYRVKKGMKGFYAGRLYDADGKRPFISVAEPLKEKDIPSWVEPIKQISREEQVEADRQFAEQEFAAAEIARKAGEEKAKEIAAVTFNEAPKTTMPSATVETL